MAFLKFLGYLVSFALAFVSAMLALYIWWQGFSHGSGSGAIVLAAIFFAICAVAIAAVAAFFLPWEDHLLLRRYISIPVLSFVIVCLVHSAIYAKNSITSFIEFKKETALENKFIHDYFANITADMEKGDGVYLMALAKLLNVISYEEIQSAFKLMCKTKFKELVPSAQTPPEQVIVSLRKEVRNIEDGYYGNRYSSIYTTAYVTLYWPKIKHILAILPIAECDNSGSPNPCFNISNQTGSTNLLEVLIGRDQPDGYAQREAMINLFKASYKQLIPSDKTTPEEFVHNLEIEMRKNNINYINSSNAESTL